VVRPKDRNVTSTPFPVATLLWQISKTSIMKIDTCEICYESFQAYNADVCKKEGLLEYYCNLLPLGHLFS